MFRPGGVAWALFAMIVAARLAKAILTADGPAEAELAGRIRFRGPRLRVVLQHFDPAYLKIDPQFMDDLAKSADSQKQVRGIAQQARGRGIHTIAERVQDATSMTLLFSAGVDFVQGDFLAPAGPDMNYDFS